MFNFKKQKNVKQKILKNDNDYIYRLQSFL